MKVKELIIELQKLNAEADIYIQHNSNPYEGVQHLLMDPCITKTDDSEEDADFRSRDYEKANLPVGTLYLRGK